MAQAAIDPHEIHALARIMDELDYYQLLNLKPGASTAEIRRAFHSSSRSFHPDANRTLEEPLREQCERISKRITEAYCVLRDPRRRKAYDARLESGSSLRIQLAEARQSHEEQRKAERRGATAQGRQFHGKAEAALKRGDLAAAIQNMQMAMTFEANNAGFKAMLAELRERQKAGR
ncbi:MAG: DnaJ domain-containing protein [Spirochaetaceae bacterium]|nr:DnaJ domain-containing protein [Myxococcales bacterium]MCB9722606.1 DnaJ domain-containing protein [Spirochaetaceae bacterium]HPG28075.1 DnaJ domain-containing protein [Myxococcota bacterium]